MKLYDHKGGLCFLIVPRVNYREHTNSFSCLGARKSATVRFLLNVGAGRQMMQSEPLYLFSKFNKK